MKAPNRPHREDAPGAKQQAESACYIHPTAIVDPNAVLGEQVRIGPYSIIGPEVTLGGGTEVMAHCVIEGKTTIGENNRFFPFCSVGLDPQDKKFLGGEKSELTIGNGNTFRESVTLHRGTPHGGGTTRIGNGNWLLAYCHVAHDCVVGNDTVFANAATLGGCVTVGDRAYLGGFTAIHPFCSVGEMTLTGGHTMIAQDVPPFVIATGNRVRLHGVNKIGMERAGCSKEEMEAMGKAYRIYFRSKLTAEDALTRLDAELSHSPVVMRFAKFIRQSKRGICR